MATERHELTKIAKKLLPEIVLAVGYMEHQLDLVSQLVLDLAETVDPTLLSEDTKSRMEMLKSVMAHASIDFANIEHPFQAYKIPKTIETKELTRDVQTRYLLAQLREGLLGD